MALMASAILLSVPASAQFGNLLNKVKDAANKADRKSVV